MSIGDDLRTFLLSDAAIVAIVGDNVSQNKVPQGTDELPAIVFRRGTSTDELSMQANQGRPSQFYESFDVEAVSEDLDESEALASLVKAKQSHRGAFGDSTVQGIFVDDHTDTYRPLASTGDDGRHVAAVDFEITGYQE